MVALVFDLKIGFESTYLVERGVEFPLDFLQDASFLELDGAAGLAGRTDEELFAAYGACPERLVRDFKLMPILHALTTRDTEIAFRAMGMINDGLANFPELFSISNLSLRHKPQIELVAADSEERDSGGHLA